MSFSILVAADLNVWSLTKGSGAPSFYKTLELYSTKGNVVYLYTTESVNPVPELRNVKYFRLPKLSSWNTPGLSNAKRLFNYFIYQFILLYAVAISHHKFQLLYAYEVEFVPALKLLSFLRRTPLVTRFQGTILHPLMKSKYWRLRFYPHYLSLKIRSNLTIMTNDGTKGDVVLSEVRSGSSSNILFLFNGTSRGSFDINNVSDRVKEIAHQKNDKYYFITVSRLVGWKRVDRSIEVFQLVHKVLPNSRLLIVGEGNCFDQLSQHIARERLSDAVVFLGAINREEVDFLMANSDIFLSHYELSNVGNPLWEALRRRCLVATLNNGDTGSVVDDGVNGIISEEICYLDNASKILEVIRNGKVDSIRGAGYETYMRLTVSWDQRMEHEYKHVTQMLESSV